jgi:hypothetical protein
MGTVPENLSRSVLLRTRTVRQTMQRKWKHTFCVQKRLFWNSCRLCDNVEKYDTVRQATEDIIWRMRFASWITKPTHTHSEYTTLFASPRLQWLCERASMLRCTYTVCLVLFIPCTCISRDQLCPNQLLRRACCSLWYDRWLRRSPCRTVAGCTLQLAANCRGWNC